MKQHFETLNRQRARLLGSESILLVATCATLVLITWAEDGGRFSFERRWPTVVGLFGLVVLFTLYAHHKHQQLARLEAQLRDLAVREEGLKARFTELSFLFDISTQLQLRLDLNGMLELATQRLLPCLDAHQASIMLHDPETGQLHVRAATGLDMVLIKNAAIPPDQGIAGHVFSTGETLILDEAAMLLRFPYEIKRSRTIVAGLCVPMRFRGAPIGVVSVTRTTGEPFTELHARMLEAFGEHAAATIVKTHHHQDLLKQMRPAA
jgi:transcriptional regulator with GAF, ATPase, and Fis domain